MNQDVIEVYHILSKANGRCNGTSKLNKYVQSIKDPSIGKNYNQLSFAQMAELASILGISGVTAESIKGDTDNKTNIKNALVRLGI